MMRTIGLIGGMSWESTALYYQAVNRGVAAQRGGLHSAPLHLISLDFADIAQRQRQGDWAGLADILVQAARRLEQGGADCVLIGTNTMHKLAPQVQAHIGIPLIHIVDVTAQAITAKGARAVGLLGTRYTMEDGFCAERLAAHGVTARVPDEADRHEVHRIIFEELCRGDCRPASRQRLLAVIDALRRQGAAGIVLGCTELPMLLSADDTDLPLFDTTALHAAAAVRFALSGGLPPTATPAATAAPAGATAPAAA